MHLSLKKQDLKKYIGGQLHTFFPDRYKFLGEDVDRALELAIEKMEYSNSRVKLPFYNNDNGEPCFYHLHGDMYAQFLYYLASSLWLISQNKPVCDKLIYLNRALHGFWVSYKCGLPKIFVLNHPVGSVIGNANYSDFLVISQNVTINTNENLRIGKGVFLGPGAKVIGKEPIGDRVSIGVNAIVYNRKIEDDAVAVLNADGNVVVRNRMKKVCVAQKFFNVSLD